MKQMKLIVCPEHAAKKNFEVQILQDEKLIHSKLYRNEEDVSYSKLGVTESCPYVTDVLHKLCDQFQVEKLSMEQGSGADRFTFGPYDDLITFQRQYIDDRLRFIQERQPNSKIEVSHDKEHPYFLVDVFDEKTAECAGSYRCYNTFSEIQKNFLRTFPLSNISATNHPDEWECKSTSFSEISADEICEQLSRRSVLQDTQITFLKRNINESSDVNMTVTVDSGINREGFSVSICDGKDEFYQKSYSYGYDVAYDRKFASEKTPFVADKLQELLDRYQVDHFSVDAGKNVFAGENISQSTIEDFKESYCKDLEIPGLSLSDTDIDELGMLKTSMEL